MFIIFIGIIAIVFGFSVAKANSPLRPHATLIRLLGLGAIVVGLLMTSLVQIEPGEVGVQKLFGKVSNTTLPSGLNFKNPLVEIVPFDIKTQNYTMSGVESEGEVRGDDAITGTVCRWPGSDH